jgi:hypothetical protein
MGLGYLRLHIILTYYRGSCLCIVPLHLPYRYRSGTYRYTVQVSTEVSVTYIYNDIKIERGNLPVHGL